jgi:hypothetical protein
VKYLHSEHNTDAEITNMKETLQQVLNSLQTKEIEIKKLEEKLNLLEKSVNSLSETFKWDQCPYSCSSTTSLKSHITKKHKNETLRSTVFEESARRLSPEKDAPRAADPSTTVESKCPAIPLNGWEPNTCGSCNEIFANNLMFMEHMVKNHGLQFNSAEYCYDCGDIFDVLVAFQYRICHGEMRAMCESCLSPTM